MKSLNYLNRFILLLFSLINLNVVLFATHIVGGNINYEYLSDGKYRINLYLYVDCQNGAPNAISLDEIANISYFDALFFLFLLVLCYAALFF